MSASVLLVGGPLDGERRPWPGAGAFAYDFEGRRYVRTQIIATGSSGGEANVWRYASLSRYEALAMLVDRYPDRRYAPPVSLDEPA